MHDDPRPYNPLDRVNLGESVADALLSRDCEPLPPPAPFVGAGIYAIHYRGTFAPYAALARPECDIPIYVGKAVPAGARKGELSLEVSTGRALHSRLRHHAKSIDAAKNLMLEDFRCRFLIVDAIWIPLAESLLIGRFQPLWNRVVDGFGINDPGQNRYGGDRSEWDELHPGRHWYSKMAAARTPNEVVAKIQRHFEMNPTP